MSCQAMLVTGRDAPVALSSSPLELLSCGGGNITSLSLLWLPPDVDSRCQPPTGSQTAAKLPSGDMHERHAWESDSGIGTSAGGCPADRLLVNISLGRLRFSRPQRESRG